MQPSVTVYFKHGDEDVAKVESMLGVQYPRVGEYVYLDTSYHVVEVAHNYQHITHPDGDDVIHVTIHLTEEA